jgi:hypothetical protein
LIPSGTGLFGYAKACSGAMMLQLSDSTHLSELTVSLPELDHDRHRESFGIKVETIFSAITPAWSGK